MPYHILNNTGSLGEHFAFYKKSEEIASLKFSDNTFLNNKRLAVSFNYTRFENNNLISSLNTLIEVGGEIILGVTLHTGVEIKREFRLKSPLKGLLIRFNSGFRSLNEDILIFSTSVKKNNDEIQKQIMLQITLENDFKREPIPQEIQDKVWNRDGGKCVKCGSNEKLEFDHIIPISKGGANTYRNLQLLCETCNRKNQIKLVKPLTQTFHP